MQNFIPLPDVINVEPLNIPEGKQELLNAHLEVLQEQFYIESIAEWQHVDRQGKRKLLRDHMRLLQKANMKLARLEGLT